MKASSLKTSSVLPSQVITTICWIAIVFGVFLRLYQIQQNDFVFYDEGMYLNHNRALLEKIAQFPPQNANDFFAIIRILFYTALATAKWLWFFISNLRVFFGGLDAYYFTRIVSALCGILTIGVTYLFARDYFKSTPIALLSAAVLAILPSHVFYSRLAMQESLSTLCFVGGMYLYYSSKNFNYKTVLASVLFSGVFFTNYRMIVLPLLLGTAEMTSSWLQKKPIAWNKLLGSILVFAAIIFWIGNLNHGSNRFITFAWMTHQAEMAPQQWHWVNIFSYPFYMFSLEGVLFTVAFFANAVFLSRRQFSHILPFALVIAQMLIFSLAAEKGARYLCVVLPFAAMAAAYVVDSMVLKSSDAFRKYRWVSILFCLGLVVMLAQKSFALTQPGSGYQSIVQKIQSRDPQAKFIATQPLIVNLFTHTDEMVKPAPKTIRDLIILYAQGYRYLIIDPQAYVSWTADGARFTTKLTDYLGFIRDNMKPILIADHLNQVLLQRFVLDHNENLINSVQFLSRRDDHFGAIYVYDLSECLEVMQKIAQSEK